MIRAAVDLLVDQLNQYVQKSGSAETVTAGNIAFLEADNSDSGINQDRVIVSLVNLEEEKALKNGRHVRTIGAETFIENRAVCLNLFLLFGAHFKHYPTGLDRLAEVIEYFQSTRVFSFRRTPASAAAPDDPRERELEIHVDLHTLSFQEINDLWGSLGGKQVPFVLYKVRLLPIRATVPLEQARTIRSIVLDSDNRS